MDAPEVELIAAGCNAINSVVDITASGIVAYGAGPNVLLFDATDNRGVKAALPKGHNGRVQAVAFLQDVNGMYGVASASADGTVRVWHCDSAPSHSYALSYELVHSSSVHTLHAFRHQDSWILASGTIEHGVYLWRIPWDLRVKSSSSAEPLQILDISPRKATSLSLIQLPAAACLWPALVTAETDNSIRLYLYNPATNAYSFSGLQLVGHQNWITFLSYRLAQADGNLVGMLASSSNDRSIRIWKIRAIKDDVAALGNSTLTELIPKKNKLAVSEERFQFEMDALLCGHESWVYSARWSSACFHAPLELISASEDRSIMIWRPDAECDGLWSITTQLGDVGSVGTSGVDHFMGFFDAFGFIKEGRKKMRYLVAHGSTGAFHIWEQCLDSGDETSLPWKTKNAVGGHMKAIESCAWSKAAADRDLSRKSHGEYLITVSGDQTTRIYAPWKLLDDRDHDHDHDHTQRATWHEIGRPQIHGHDLQAIATLSGDRFMSGADEKVVRIFEAPYSFKAVLTSLGGTCSILEKQDMVQVSVAVPALGLTNKATTTATDKQDLATAANPIISLQQPPTEAELMTKTLWPELEKLYGHGYELYSVAVSGDSSLAVTASKAASAQHAALRFWDTRTWKCLGELLVHTLTVTKMVFSAHGKWLLTVSRDRNWAIIDVGDYANDANCTGNQDFNPKVVQKFEGHSRIVWAAAWMPLSEKHRPCFATGSRDRKLKLWQQKAADNWSIVAELELPHPVTAVDFYEQLVDPNHALLAVGLESGDVLVYRVSLPSLVSKDGATTSIAFELMRTLERGRQASSASIADLKWRPAQETCREAEQCKIWLATVSADHSVRIYSWPLGGLQTTSALS